MKNFTERDILNAAITAHNVNQAYCLGLDDWSQKSWPEAPNWQKESAIKGVKFLIANPTAGPDESHKSWLKEKESTGWVYGEVKDPVKKTHPCIVAYEELSISQRMKDTLFQATVKGVLGVDIQTQLKEEESSVKFILNGFKVRSTNPILTYAKVLMLLELSGVTGYPEQIYTITFKNSKHELDGILRPGDQIIAQENTVINACVTGAA